MAQQGRGWLSSIELLGEDYDDIVVWASAELRERKRRTQDILFDFNQKLTVRAREIGDADFKPISNGAFGRYSMRLAGIARRYENTRVIAEALTTRMKPGDQDKLTIAAGEAIKMAVFEIIGESGEAGLSLKELKMAGDALRSSVGAMKISTDLKAKVEEGLKAQIDAAEKDAVERGDTDGAALLKKIREEIYGIFET
jgi:hypothetical protein